MKQKIFVLMFVAVFSAQMGLVAQNKKQSHFKTVTFDVSMTCESCKKTFEKNIAFEKGMKDIHVNLNNKTVTLTFDTRKTNENRIIEAFDKLGYTAKVAMPPNPK